MAANGSIEFAPQPSGSVVIERLDAIARMPATDMADRTDALAAELLTIGETALEAWLEGQNRPIEERTVEGFRLLGLHRQGARGDPSFNACRETCRELVYRTNCARLGADNSDSARQLRLAAMVARHLVLFIDGKLETAGLGEFCCSSKGLRGSITRPMPSNDEQE